MARTFNVAKSDQAADYGVKPDTVVRGTLVGERGLLEGDHFVQDRSEGEDLGFVVVRAGESNLLRQADAS